MGPFQKHQALMSRHHSMLGNRQPATPRPPIMSMPKPPQQPASPVRIPQNPYVNSPPLGAQQRVSAPSTTRPSNTGMPNAPSSVRTLNLRQLANERLMQEQANVDRENQKRMLGYIRSVKPFASEFESRYGGQATAPTGYLDQVSGATYDPVSVDKKYEEYARTVDPQAEILDPRIHKVKPGFGSPNFGFSAQVPSWLLGR